MIYSPTSALSPRKMFGGICLYLDGTVFALISSDSTLYLKAKGDAAQALSADGATQFHNMPYWSIPEAALDDSQEACTLERHIFASLE